MRRFHVIATTDDLSCTLVTMTPDGWRLPSFDDDARVGLPDQLRTLLSRLVSANTMIHEAPMWPEPDDAALHGCCVAHVSGPTRSADVSLTPTATLLSMPAALPRQKEAWGRALDRLRAPRAPFDSGAQVAAMRAWADQQVLACAGGRIVSMSPHRCTRHESVVRFDTTVGTMYFKGGLDRVTDEGVLTGLLHDLSPKQFPETLVIDLVDQRWLYRILAGDLLSGARLTASAAVAAARVLAGVQKRALREPAVETHLAARRMNALQLFEHADRIVQQAWQSVRVPTMMPAIDHWGACRGVLSASCVMLDQLSVPASIVFSDFWSRNIVATPEGIGFIDVEQSYWSHPFLSLWPFGNEIEWSRPDGVATRTLMEQAFVREWADVVAPAVMTRALMLLPLLGKLFGILMCSRELDLHARGLGSELPAGYRATRLSGHVTRLIEHVTGKPYPRPLNAR